MSLMGKKEKSPLLSLVPLFLSRALTCLSTWVCAVGGFLFCCCCCRCCCCFSFPKFELRPTSRKYCNWKQHTVIVTLALWCKLPARAMLKTLKLRSRLEWKLIVGSFWVGGEYTAHPGNLMPWHTFTVSILSMNMHYNQFSQWTKRNRALLFEMFFFFKSLYIVIMQMSFYFGVS